MDSLTDEEIISHLRNIIPQEFEHFVADIWRSDGFDTQVTSGSGDRGIDVVAVRNALVKEKILIQAKRYGKTSSVSSPEVQQYASLIHQEESVDKAVIVTTGEFTDQARSLASQHGLVCIDHDRLVNIINDNGLEELVISYSEGEGKPNVKEERLDSTETTDSIDVDTTNDSEPVVAEGKNFRMEIVAIRDGDQINEYTDGRYKEITEMDVSEKLGVFIKIENLASHSQLTAHKIIKFISEKGYEYQVCSFSSGALAWELPGDWSTHCDISHGQTKDWVIVSTDIPSGVNISKIKFDLDNEILTFDIPDREWEKLENTTLDIDVE